MLQGLCWDFFFTAGDIYVDRKAKPEIRAQAQGLRFIVSNGFGLLFASTICGQIFNTTVTETGDAALPQWSTFWVYPAIVAAVVTLFFIFFFKDDVSKKEIVKIKKHHKELQHLNFKIKNKPTSGANHGCINTVC